MLYALPDHVTVTFEVDPISGHASGVRPVQWLDAEAFGLEACDRDLDRTGLVRCSREVGHAGEHVCLTIALDREPLVAWLDTHDIQRAGR